jgi:hypothetical protein
LITPERNCHSPNAKGNGVFRDNTTEMKYLNFRAVLKSKRLETLCSGAAKR